MANLSGPATLSYLQLYTSDTTLQTGYQLGQLQEGPNGQWFRYALAGASNLVVGNLLQSAAIDTQFVNMAVLATAIATSGFQTVNITNGTTTVAANDFANGQVTVYTTPDLGSSYTILSHSTGTSTAALTAVVDHWLATAWTTSTKVTMSHNPQWKVIQAVGTTLTGLPAGVAIYAIPTATYGWVQTHGMGAVLTDDDSILVGSALVPSDSLAGGVALEGVGVGANVGVAYAAGSSTHVIPAFLTID